MPTPLVTSELVRWVCAGLIAVSYAAAAPLGAWIDDKGLGHARVALAPLVALAACAAWRCVWPSELRKRTSHRWHLVAVVVISVLAIIALSLSPSCLQPGMGQGGSLFDLVTLVLVVPAAEEWLFRGVLLEHLLQERGVAAAVVSTSLLFAVIHFPSGKPVLMGAAGGALAAVALLGNSVGWPIILHAAWNATAVVARMDGEQPRYFVAFGTAGVLLLTGTGLFTIRRFRADRF